MASRLASVLFAAACLFAPTLAFAQANSPAGEAPAGNNTSTDNNTSMEARLHRDERALIQAERDLADIARQRLRSGARELNAATEQSLAEAEKATHSALQQVRKSLHDFLGPDRSGDNATEK